jgi:hypothetical protein
MPSEVVGSRSSALQPLFAEASLKSRLYMGWRKQEVNFRAEDTFNFTVYFAEMFIVKATLRGQDCFY